MLLLPFLLIQYSSLIYMTENQALLTFCLIQLFKNCILRASMAVMADIAREKNMLSDAPKQHKREAWVDAVKGGAILLIINAHITRIPLCFPLDYLVICYVTLFFSVAGYTFSLKRESYGIFCRKKAERLLIPYACYSLFAYLCLLPWLVYKGLWSYSLLGIIYARFFLVPHGEHLLNIGNAPLWFLPAMFVAYCFFRGLLTLSSPLRIVAGLCCFALPALACVSPFLLPWSLDVAGLAALCMLGGYYMKGQLGRQGVWVQLICAAFSLAIFILMGYLLGPVNISIAEYGNKSLLPVWRVGCLLLMTLSSTYLLALFFIFLDGTYVTRFFAWCGRMSLMLLCTHIYIGHAAEAAFRVLKVPPLLAAPLCLMLILFCAKILSDVCRKYGEKWRFLKYL